VSTAIVVVLGLLGVGIVIDQKVAEQVAAER
jgi:hypothetical protein